MIERGQIGTFHHPGGSSQAVMTRDRGAHRYDLVVEDVPTSETQMVPLRPGDDGRWFEPAGMEPAPPATPLEEPLRLVPAASSPPNWPAITALVLATVSMGLSIVNLLIR